ncbi:LOW QUALITY PROTEIN: hypothetical protein PanWU01x14_114300 [Parasponia andersonii]|uniref:Uncharacterized protein n=1 Tax=Parasponia andersonii TaxID=3476 RepID=A0A2P5CXD9_PARAD|nr:LOW QUALITY PROTEIN: hypothetical protein PanWU01x14_114300 [Parasponia andersonii]
MDLNLKSKPRFISKNLDKNLDLSLSSFFLDLFVILKKKQMREKNYIIKCDSNIHKIHTLIILFYPILSNLIQSFKIV